MTGLFLIPIVYCFIVCWLKATISILKITFYSYYENFIVKIFSTSQRLLKLNTWNAFETQLVNEHKVNLVVHPEL